MNKYLKKIAKIMEYKPGHYINTENRDLYVSPEVAKEIDTKLDNKHIIKGTKTIGTIGMITGGGLGAAFGPNSAFRGKSGSKPALFRAGVGMLLGGLSGAGAGALLANGGNRQIRGSEKALDFRRKKLIYDPKY